MEVIQNISHELNEFTPEQKEKVQQLRARVLPLLTPEQNDDSYLVRWLIARNYNLDEAEDMLKKHIKFLKANGMDKFGEDYKPNEIFDYFYTAMLGYDNDGSVVRILHVGASDLRGLCLSIPQADCLKYAFYVLASDARRQKQERTNAAMNDKQVYILDLQGLSWRAIIQRIVIKRAFVLLKCYEANHPEKLKVAYVVNVPSFFSFIYNWLKTVLPESILSKIQVLSQDDLQYSTLLSRTMDPTILPAAVGGNRKDPDGDPNCPSLYSKPLGTPIPESMMPTNPLEALKNDPAAKKITIASASIFIVEKVVSEINSMLQWDFQTLDYDIRMGLRCKRNENSESEEIIPAHRVDSHIFPESGSFMCETPGIYEIVFDNTYSWMTSKELLFKVNVLLPQDQDN